jgi:Fe-S cluster assembly protein SufD
MAMQLVKEDNAYADAFRRLPETRNGAEPSWLRSMRENAFECFEQVGFPTVQHEEWKYTNTAAISKARFSPVLSGKIARHADSNELARFFYDEARGSRLVFLNGILQKELSSLEALPAGVVAIDLLEALGNSQHKATVREHLERDAEPTQNGFTALNTSLFSSGALVLIPAGVKVDAPIHLLFVSEASNSEAPASFPRVLVVAAANSSATIMESYASPSEAAYLTNAAVKFDIRDGASLKHYKVQRESTRAFHVANTNVELGAKAIYDTTAINLGAAISRHDIGVTMDHEGAECWVDGLYMIDGSQHTDTHSLIDHRQPRCTSHQLYKGILDGKARAVFNGKVFVRHGAQQTDAQQTNKNLLLSNEARVDTKPQLEIFADDVKCAHGAAIGQLEEDEVFYLESRGINPKLARNLLTYGFAEEVIEKIKIDSIKRELDEAVLNRLHVDLETP